MVCGKRVEKALARAGLKPYELNWRPSRSRVSSPPPGYAGCGVLEKGKIMATLRGYTWKKPIKSSLRSALFPLECPG